MTDKENEGFARAVPPNISNSNNSNEFVITLPEQVHHLFQTKTDDNAKALDKQLQKSNWMTESLWEEVAKCAPTQDEIDKSNNGARNMEAFKQKVGTFLVVGRRFASAYQLKQYVTEIAKPWAFQPRSHGKQLVCHYSTPKLGKDTRYKANMTVPPKRVHESRHTNCPFEIRTQPINHKKGIPAAFLQVKITSVCLDHNCRPSIISHRQAIQKSGKLALDLSDLKYVLHSLYHDPTMPANKLRPILEKHLPDWKSLGPQFLCNFRKRCSLHLYGMEILMTESSLYRRVSNCSREKLSLLMKLWTSTILSFHRISRKCLQPACILVGERGSLLNF